MASSFGYQQTGYGYRRPQAAPRPVTYSQRPDNRGGPFGANPAFPSLAALRPDNRANIGINPPRPAPAPPPHPAAAPAATQRPATTQPAQQPIQQPQFTYDYSSDPVLQQIQALGTQGRADVESGTLAAKKRVAVDYGDSDLARTLGEDATAQAAAGNPNSVFGQLRKGYDTGVHNLDEQLNNENLFYGGNRIVRQGQAANDYQSALAGATSQEQGLLGDIDQGRLARLLELDSQGTQGMQDAAQRAITAGVSQGGTFVGWNDDGTPKFSFPQTGQGSDLASTLGGESTSDAGSYGEDLPFGYVVGGAHRRRGLADLLAEVGG